MKRQFLLILTTEAASKGRRVRFKLVGIRFAAKPGLDVRFRGDAGDIRARGGGRWKH